MYARNAGPFMAPSRAGEGDRALLPPDSPDLNPVELAISKLKRLLRDAGERPLRAG